MRQTTSVIMWIKLKTMTITAIYQMVKFHRAKHYPERRVDAAVSGCGSTEVADEPTKPDTATVVTGQENEPADEQAEEPAPLPAPEKAGIGDTLDVPAMETDLAITVKATKRAAALKSYGMEMHGPLYGVRIRIKNVGGSVYDDAVSNCVALIDSKGEAQQPSFAPSDEQGSILKGTIESVKIAPESFREGWTWFDVEKKVKPRLFQYAPDSGFADTVGEWVLR